MSFVKGLQPEVCWVPEEPWSGSALERGSGEGARLLPCSCSLVGLLWAAARVQSTRPLLSTRSCPHEQTPSRAMCRWNARTARAARTAGAARAALPAWGKAAPWSGCPSLPSAGSSSAPWNSPCADAQGDFTVSVKREPLNKQREPLNKPQSSESLCCQTYCP